MDRQAQVKPATERVPSCSGDSPLALVDDAQVIGTGLPAACRNTYAVRVTKLVKSRTGSMEQANIQYIQRLTRETSFSSCCSVSPDTPVSFSRGLPGSVQACAIVACGLGVRPFSSLWHWKWGLDLVTYAPRPSKGAGKYIKSDGSGKKSPSWSKNRQPRRDPSREALRSPCAVRPYSPRAA